LVYLIELCESLAVRLYVILDFNARTGRPTSLIESDGLDLLMFLREPLQNPVRRLAKRLFDILFSSLVLLIVFPFVALLTKLMQVIQSPGPMFFRQHRNGQSNRVFRIFKFRSMHDRDHEEQRQASRGDARIYPFGRLLRATSMDELPQFLNVLRGDMSVVGPRPHLTLHNDAWQRLLRPYHLRSYVKPGITGLAQTRGLRGEVGSDEEIRKRIECDIEYVENWSLMLDLWIVILTIWQIFFPPKKAY
jgi:lipopolysaccharide/colanic/teichoic acid biosynthesis glycosyltransferase